MNQHFYFVTGFGLLKVKYEHKINHGGITALASFNFLGPSAAKYKTLITQEMLNEGYLASNSIYVCTGHTDEIIMISWK